MHSWLLHGGFPRQQRVGDMMYGRTDCNSRMLIKRNSNPWHSRVDLHFRSGPYSRKLFVQNVPDLTLTKQTYS